MNKLDTTMHRCSVLPPLSDDAHEWRVEEAEKRERDDAITRRNWAICDAVCSTLLVLILALVIGGRL